MLQLYRDFQFSAARLYEILVNSKYAFFSFSCILSFRYIAAIHVLFFILVYALLELLHCSCFFMHCERCKIVCLMLSAV